MILLHVYIINMKKIITKSFIIYQSYRQKQSWVYSWVIQKRWKSLSAAYFKHNKRTFIDVCHSCQKGLQFRYEIHRTIQVAHFNHNKRSNQKRKYNVIYE